MTKVEKTKEFHSVGSWNIWTEMSKKHDKRQFIIKPAEFNLMSLRDTTLFRLSFCH